MKTNQSVERKKIGIVGHLIGGAFGIGIAYMEYFSQFGDVEIISHTENEVRTHLDLLVIPGGPDVDPSRYLGKKDKVSLKTQKPCIIRERFDRVLLPEYIAAGIPMFGICRGHQTLAVHFGGTLKQHMYHETNDDDRTSAVHYVSFAKNVLNGNYELDKADFLPVNSIHHQVVQKVPENAKVIARYLVVKGASESNIPSIEALAYPGLPIFTVQWHPEEVRDAFSEGLIKNLLKLDK